MVDRCICFDITFADLLRLRDQHHLSLDQLKARTGCCTGCTLCEPYVRLALQTGQTHFIPLTATQIKTIMTNPAP